MPLLPFASCLPADCRVACCRMPPPCVTFHRAAAACVQTMATVHHAIAIVVDVIVCCAVAIAINVVVRRAVLSVVRSPSSSLTSSSLAPSPSSATSLSVALSSLSLSLPVAPSQSSLMSLPLRRCHHRRQLCRLSRHLDHRCRRCPYVMY